MGLVHLPTIPDARLGQLSARHKTVKVKRPQPHVQTDVAAP